jgi:hypothetical protein
LAANGIGDESLVPPDYLRRALRELGGHLDADAEGFEGNERQVARLSGVHLVRRPKLVFEV